MSRRFAIDFHVHTSYSVDSLTPPRLAIEMARRRGLDGIAVTDHDTVQGALETVKANPYSDFLVIPGIEVKSDRGDVIGLYVKEEIRSRLFADVIDEIRDQGGIVYLPHPIRTFGAPAVPGIFEEYTGIDAWERYNGRYNAHEFALADDAFDRLPVGRSYCGSDAHFPWEIGLFRTVLERMPHDARTLMSLAAPAQLNAAPRGDLALRTGITLGSMIKDFKRRRYGKVGALTATLPYRVLRRTARLGLQRLRG
jgi:predicted metal-dependent phosphoesterase TrpH